MVKSEAPHATAEYILQTDLGTSETTQHYQRWACVFMWDVKQVTWRLFHINHIHTSTTLSSTRETRRTFKASVALNNKTPTCKKRKKPGVNNRPKGNLKYGIEVPNDYKDAMGLDRANGNTLWRDSVTLEMDALINHKCFEFRSPDCNITKDYQYAPLRMIYEVKSNLRRNARLVIHGFKVDPHGLSTRDTVVKGIPVRLLDILSH